jgi:hypothetical protein
MQINIATSYEKVEQTLVLKLKKTNNLLLWTIFNIKNNMYRKNALLRCLTAMDNQRIIQSKTIFFHLNLDTWML